MTFEPVYLARKTILEMLNDRGYNDISSFINLYSVPEFKAFDYFGSCRQKKDNCNHGKNGSTTYDVCWRCNKIWSWSCYEQNGRTKRSVK